MKANSPSSIPALTLILLLERLRAAVPGMIIVHGNALYDKSRNRPLLIAGASGSGKSSLSRELLSTSRFTLLAEDTLLIAPGEGLLHSFPRAASLRVTSGVAGSQTQWKGLGPLREQKVLVPPSRIHSSPVSLANAAVLLLNSGERPSSNPPPDQAERFRISHASPELAAELANGFPSATIEIPDDEQAFPLVAIPHVLDSQSRIDFLNTLASHGAMVLASRVGLARSTTTPMQRPPTPVINRSSPLEGLRSLLNHEVHFAAPDIATSDASRVLMNSAFAFHNACFHELTPGGTPAETAQCILHTLKEAG